MGTLSKIIYCHISGEDWRELWRAFNSALVVRSLDSGQKITRMFTVMKEILTEKIERKRHGYFPIIRLV